MLSYESPKEDGEDKISSTVLELQNGRKLKSLLWKYFESVLYKICAYISYASFTRNCFGELRSTCEKTRMKLFMHSSTRYRCQVGACGQLLVKLLNINFREDPFCGSSGVTGGRTLEGYHFFKTLHRKVIKKKPSKRALHCHCVLYCAVHEGHKLMQYYTNAVQKTNRV